MGTIKAGVVVVNQYCKPDSKIYSGYIKYMDRKEAVRTMHTAEFDMFNDYMGNPDKTSGLFTEKKRNLTECEIVSLKNLFQKAQDNGSYMWQTVISFDNLWLEQFGLYDSQSKILYEEKIKELATNGILKMLHNEKLDHAIWSAAIHYNTDNIHVHVATVEVEPMREKKLYQQYTYSENEKHRLVKDGIIVDLNGNPVFKEEIKGKFNPKSFELCKQYITNEIIREKDQNKEINEIIRNRMVRTIKNNKIFKDPKMTKMLQELYLKMPDCPKNMWNYGNNIMAPLKNEIDGISDYYLQNYLKEDYERLHSLLDKQNELYKTAYGSSYTERDYKETKLQDLHARMGNSILKMIRGYEGSLEVRSCLEKNVECFSQSPEEIPITLQESDRDNSGILSEIPVSHEMEMKLSEISNDSYYIEWDKSYKSAKQVIQQYLLTGEEKDMIRAKNAFQELEKHAQKGNLLAIYDIGIFMKNERFFLYNGSMSQSYLKEAYHGFLLVLERMDKTNLTDEREEFLYNYVTYKLGQMNNKGIGTEQDYEVAAEYFEESKSSYAKYALGELYFNGYGVEQDYEKAAICYEQSLQLDSINPYANYRLGEMHQKGLSFEPNSEKAFRFYEKALSMFHNIDSVSPDMYVKYRIGYMYYHGLGTAVDSQKAESYFLESERLGNKNACYLLGSMYLNPELKIYDLKKGIFYLEQAADQGNEYAQYRLGCLYVNPDLETYDLEKGMNYLRLSAEQGNSYAECKIGDVYFYQMNDSKSALKHYMASSRQGNSLARSRALKALVGTGMGQSKMRKNWEFDKALRDLKKSFQKDFKAWKNILEHDREFEKRVRNGQEDVLET